MPTTPLLGLPYPSSDDPPDGPLAFRQLAEAVEADLVPGGPRPTIQIKMSTTQTIWSTAGLLQIPFDATVAENTSDVDGNTFYPYPGASDRRIRVKRAGLYLCVLNMFPSFQGMGLIGKPTSTNSAWDGSAGQEGWGWGPGLASPGSGLTATALRRLAPDAYIAAWMQKISGAGNTAGADSVTFSQRFTVTYLGP